VIRDVSAAGGGGGGRGGGGGAATPPTFAVRSFALDQHVDVYSSGAEWQFQPSSKLGTVVGAAVSWQRRAGLETEAAPTWIAGVSYDATTDLRLHASMTRKIRVPSIDQLFSTSSGNPGLRSERAYGVDVGADQRLSRASTIGISAFVTHAKDFIERIGALPFDNQGTYRFAGAEVTAQTAAIDWLELRGAYTFLDSDDVTPGAGNRELQTRPRHRGSLEWTWRVAPRSSVRGAVQYVGRQLYDSRGSAPTQVPADSYTVVDLGFTQALTRRYAITFDVTNAFDQLYDQGYGLPREGRTALLTLRARVN
jgi:iron complex outermembrane receptor protein